MCQRYGIEVNGGAEYHARLLAEKLSSAYDITVLTTTAIDYHTWENFFDEGAEHINGVLVSRFATIEPKPRQLRKSRRIIFGNRKYFKFLRALGIFNFLNEKLRLTRVSPRESEEWLKCQGPYCPGMMEFIKSNESLYDAFIFFTYLYYPTAIGMPLVRHKSIFIPTAHDEPPLYRPPYAALFSQPKFIMYNSQAEKDLVESHFKQYTKAHDVAGVGITPHIPSDVRGSSDLIPDSPYFLYIGRIERNKGCHELVSFFKEYATGKKLKLVMVGRDFMDLEASDIIVKTGFISDDQKYQLLEKCVALIIPSKYESLSMVALEAMIQGKIVIVNGACEVLKDHVENSKSGFYYKTYQEFCVVLNNALGMPPDDVAQNKENAIAYVKKHYTWESILRKFDQAIAYVTDEKARDQRLS
ncbi:glycosyltransferase family 4 protein [Niabella insulamsoli]|uniref:glycosyltransferase family 4 protein n=1 Tax=Niabella insulamsoli TaxID=3144874 RepID=UPI0031FCF2EC